MDFHGVSPKMGIECFEMFELFSGNFDLLGGMLLKKMVLFSIKV